MKMPQKTLQLYRTERSETDPLGGKHGSPATVARLVGRLLNEIAAMDNRATHSEIIQALLITTAVRQAMADAATSGLGDRALAASRTALPAAPKAAAFDA